VAQGGKGLSPDEHLPFWAHRGEPAVYVQRGSAA
jgi:hypothetical protein